MYCTCTLSSNLYRNLTRFWLERVETLMLIDVNLLNLHFIVLLFFFHDSDMSRKLHNSSKCRIRIESCPFNYFALSQHIHFQAKKCTLYIIKCMWYPMCMWCPACMYLYISSHAVYQMPPRACAYPYPTVCFWCTACMYVPVHAPPRGPAVSDGHAPCIHRIWLALSSMSHTMCLRWMVGIYVLV